MAQLEDRTFEGKSTEHLSWVNYLAQSEVIEHRLKKYTVVPKLAERFCVPALE